MVHFAIFTFALLTAGQSAFATWDFQSGCNRAKPFTEKSKAYLAAEDYVKLSDMYQDFLQTLAKKVGRFCMTVTYSKAERYNDQDFVTKGFARLKGIGPGERIRFRETKEICDSDKDLALRVASLTKYKNETIRPLAQRVRAEMEALKPTLNEYYAQYKFKRSWDYFSDAYLEFANWVYSDSNPLQVTAEDFDWSEIKGERCESQRAWAAMNRGRGVVIP